MNAAQYAYEMLRPRDGFTPGLFGAQPVRRVLVLSGGGIDSLACLLAARRWFNLASQAVGILNIGYGQKTQQAEHQAARQQYKRFCGSFYALDDTLYRNLKNPLDRESRDEVKGSTTEAQHNDYVPFRNARFLSAAVAIAESEGYDTIALGAVGGVNPDNSYQFVQAMQQVIATGTHTKINLYAPFVLQTKSMVPLFLSAFEAEGYPLVLSEVGGYTTSCFNSDEVLSTGEVLQCGTCRSCTSLKQAFKFAGVKDPYLYATEN